MDTTLAKPSRIIASSNSLPKSDDLHKDVREHLRNSLGQASNKSVQKNITTQAVERYNLSHAGVAERFVAKHGHEVRWSSTRPCWMLWDGVQWTCDADFETDRMMIDVVRDMYVEARDVPDLDQRTKFMRFVLRAEALGFRNSALETVKTLSGITMSEAAFDSDPYVLNVENGILDLRTGELYEHDPDRYLTKLAPVHFNPEAGAPTWDRFISRIMCGDQEMIDYLTRASGYSLTGDVSQQAAFLGIGSGANGKTTFLNTIRRVMGDYAMRTPADTLVARKRGDSSHDIARLVGARLVAVSETSTGAQLDEARLKEITGKETIVARKHFKSNFEFEPQFTIWLMTNSLPNIRETNNGIWRRLFPIPFDAQISDDERDPHLEEKLLAERSGILNWLLKGARDWQRDGLPLPQKVRDLIGEYRASMDVIGSFLRECVVSAPGSRVSLKQMYEVYCRWAAEGREFIWKKRTFNRALREREFVSENNMPNGGPAWQNVALTNEGRVLLQAVQPSLR